MEKNEMCNSGNSPELSKKLDASQTPDLEAKLSFLKQCGVDEKYLEMFAVASKTYSDRLTQALGKQPTEEEVSLVNSNLEFVSFSLDTYSSSRIRGQVMAAANDDDFSLAA